MKRFFLVPALGLATLAFSPQAHAQQLGAGTADMRPAFTDERQPYYEARRGAYDNGYREGVKQGEKDGRSRRARNYQDDRAWQRGDTGYNRSFGDFERYRQQFRVGFAEGYQAAYARYGRGYGGYQGQAVPRQDGYAYPDRNGSGYPDGNRYPDRGYGDRGGYDTGRAGPAYANGLNDGIEKGRDDARKRHAYDPFRQSWYRSGDRNYHNQYGPKPLYQSAYRDGFKEGYDRGYREFGFVR